MKTLTELAEELGTSVATVSNALNGTGRVSDKMKKRVLNLAQQYGYSSSEHSRSILGKRLNIVGLIYPGMGDGFGQHVLNGIEEVLAPKGFNTLLWLSKDKLERDLQAVRRFDQLSLSGVLYQPGAHTDSVKVQKALKKADLQHVVMYRRSSGDTSPGVLIDHAEGFQRGLDYLYELGHRNISYLYSRNTPESVEGVIAQKVFSEFAKSRKVKCPLLHWKSESVEKWVKSGHTAFLCESDELGVSLIERLQQSKIRVPQEVSVIGFRDSLTAKTVRPMLTSLHVPAEQMGHEAARALLTRMELAAKGDTQALKAKFTLELSPELIIRGSAKNI